MHEWKRSLLIGTIVALASQLYWNVFVSGFRISSAVILLPVLLMTIGKSVSTIQISVATAAVVFLSVSFWQPAASLLPRKRRDSS